MKKSFKNISQQNSNWSSNFGCDWTLFHSKNKIKPKNADARVWGDILVIMLDVHPSSSNKVWKEDTCSIYPPCPVDKIIHLGYYKLRLAVFRGWEGSWGWTLLSVWHQAEIQKFIEAVFFSPLMTMLIIILTWMFETLWSKIRHDVAGLSSHHRRFKRNNKTTVLALSMSAFACTLVH